MPSIFDQTRTQFYLPDDICYLNGNSLGPLPLAAPDAAQRMLKAEWGELQIRGWNQANWINQPAILGNRLARLLGAEPDSVVLGETLSIRLVQALAAALDLAEASGCANKSVILTDSGNFPSDLYLARELLRSRKKTYELKVVEPHEVDAALDEQVAVLMLTQVDYRTGRMHSIEQLTDRAHQVGAYCLWDLAHSAGAVPVNLSASCVDFAVGCTYKYLNSGPGGPAFIYVASGLIDQVQPLFPGWMGHARPFDFDIQYQPAPGIRRMQVGTPPILALAVLATSLDIWEQVDMAQVRQASAKLSDLFIEQVNNCCPELTLASPLESENRGSQISFYCRQGYPLMQALIAQGVIGDFREPDLIRFGISPLYNNHADIERAAGALAEILRSGVWQEPRFQKRELVT